MLVAPDGPVEERLARVPELALTTVDDVAAATERLGVVSGWELPDGVADELFEAVRHAAHRLPSLLYEVTQSVAFVESLLADPFADYLPRDADPDGRLLAGRVRTLASYLRSLAELDLEERLPDHTPMGITVTDPSLSGTPIVYANRVFEPGFSSPDRGNGLGLGIVGQVADAHGWSVRVTDGEDGGARFEVRNVDTVE